MKGVFRLTSEWSGWYHLACDNSSLHAFIRKHSRGKWGYGVRRNDGVELQRWPYGSEKHAESKAAAVSLAKAAIEAEDATS